MANHPNIPEIYQCKSSADSVSDSSAPDVEHVIGCSAVDMSDLKPFGRLKMLHICMLLKMKLSAARIAEIYGYELKYLWAVLAHWVGDFEPGWHKNGEPLCVWCRFRVMDLDAQLAAQQYHSTNHLRPERGKDGLISFTGEQVQALCLLCCYGATSQQIELVTDCYSEIVGEVLALWFFDYDKNSQDCHQGVVHVTGDCAGPRSREVRLCCPYSYIRTNQRPHFYHSNAVLADIQDQNMVSVEVLVGMQMNYETIHLISGIPTLKRHYCDWRHHDRAAAARTIIKRALAKTRSDLERMKAAIQPSASWTGQSFTHQQLSMIYILYWNDVPVDEIMFYSKSNPKVVAKALADIFWTRP